MSAEARTFVNLLSVSDPLSVLILRTIAEHTITVSAPRVCISLRRRELAIECKTTLRKVNDRLKKLAEAGLIEIDDDIHNITLVGFEAFFVGLKDRSTLASRRAEEGRFVADAGKPVSRPKPSSSRASGSNPVVVGKPSERMSEGKHDTLIDSLKADGVPANVLDIYLRPLARLLIIGHSNPGVLFTEIATALVDYPDHVLEALYRHTRQTRSKLVSVKQVNDDLAKVLPTVRRHRISKEHHKVQWQAWKHHYEALGPQKASLFRYYEGQGYLSEITEWPPRHWANQASGDKAGDETTAEKAA